MIILSPRGVYPTEPHLSSLAPLELLQTVFCANQKNICCTHVHIKAMSHDRMITVIKDNDLCMNCLKSGHFSKHCPSLSKCRKCQKPHHTLIHINPKESEQGELSSNTSAIQPAISSNTTTGFTPDTLRMTCQILKTIYFSSWYPFHDLE